MIRGRSQGHVDMEERSDSHKPSFSLREYQGAGAETMHCEMCSDLVVNRGVLDCCNHWFCFSCIDNWSIVTNVCPLCKARFRFITCLPVGFQDDGSWDDPNLSSREDGSNQEDNNLPFSFPSYFIDEEAVVCLEGGACRVRAGLLSDVESALAAETSVACDLCDCWYHAGCVNFDPDQSTFYCPRCIPSQQTSENSLRPLSSGAPVSSGARVSSLVGPLPAEKELSYSGGTLRGTASVAIAIADEGESAVSISMRRIPNGHQSRAQPRNKHEKAREVMWSPIREPAGASQTSGVMWSPIPEPVNASQTSGVMWSPIRNQVSVPQESGQWSPTREPENEAQKLMELMSPTREPVNEIQKHLELMSPTREPVNNGQRHVDYWSSQKGSGKNLQMQKGLWSPTPTSRSAFPGNVLRDQPIGKGFDSSLSNTGSSTHIVPTTEPWNRTDDLGSSMMKDEDMLIDVDRLQAAVEQLRKGKRKVLHEDTRMIDSNDLAEPPSKVSRNTSWKLDASEDGTLATTKDLSSNTIVDDTTNEQRDQCHTKVSGSLSLEKDACKEVSVEGKWKGLQEDERKIDSKDHPEPPIACGETSRKDICKEVSLERKRKVVHEDERRIDLNDLPEPPRKVARKTSKKIDVSDNQSLVEDSSSTGILGEIVIKPSDDAQAKASSEAILNEDNGVSFEEKDTQEVDTHQYGERSMSEEQETPVVEPLSAADAKEIVSNPQDNGTKKGVRTRIIMHREADSTDDAGSTLVDRIRQQMRDSAGYVGGEEVGKMEVSDDRFVAAFKAALARNNGKHKDTKSFVGKQRRSSSSSSWLTKVLSDGKSSRESLTKKLYGGGTNRYDRDWDIAFWKERSSQLQKARKEAEVEVLGKTQSKKSDLEEDSIFSRLYVADTSLFPRDDNVKPLSAAVKDNSSGAVSLLGSKEMSKLAEMSSTKSAPFKGGTSLAKGVMPTANDKLNTSLGVSPKLLTKPQLSTASKSPRDKSELTTSASDVQKDKRQWALEVLARKTGNTGKSPGNAAGGSASNQGQFELLLQLPIEMRPLLPHNRHSKVPTAVRQVQLNRILEQELKRANLPILQNDSECEEVVNRARAREEELFKKSNSKGVYVNLCVRSLAQPVLEVTVPEESMSDLSDKVQKALEATGLVDTPPASPSRLQADPSPVPTKDDLPSASTSGCKPKATSEDKWVENVLEMGNLDISGDFEFGTDNDFGDPIPPELSSVAKLESASSFKQTDHRTHKMMVVLTTATSSSYSAPEHAESFSKVVSNPSLQNDGAVDGKSPATLPPSENKGVQGEDDCELNSGLELELDVKPTVVETVLVGTVSSEASALIPSISQLTEETHLTKTAKSISDSVQVNLGHGEVAKSPKGAATNSVDDWMDTGKFSDLDRRIENIRRNTSPSSNTESVPWNSKVGPNIELTLLTDSNNAYNSVKKQVEIFVNQHLKPLYRSGVIKADQFRYAVSKTAAKVMEHHENASSADFLITEGSKVRKLADQYLQSFAKRKVH